MESTSDPEGRASKRKSIKQDTGPETAIARVMLETCFRNHYPDLAQMLRPYILQMGLATNRQEAERVAFDVLADAYIEVQTSSQNYNITRSAKAWIVGLALNLLRRRRTTIYRRSVTEVPFAPDVAAALVGEVEDTIRNDMRDRFIFRLLLNGSMDASLEPEEFMVHQQAAHDHTVHLQRAKALMLTLDPMDQGVLNASIQTNFDSAATARLLGIRPGAARTRLHRALNRLRAAYFRDYPLQDTVPDERG
ncbi:MAG TPA: hypothetical protein VJN88_04380 [Ktedonobacterales bacterium]|nr:hypothetical protein [Ktedonobacterales bacterium]